jgi:HPt (histidine-containing phosphotransfer) domain-containing protein
MLNPQDDAHYNTSFLLDMLGNNQSAVADLRKMFIDLGPQMLHTIEVALETQQWEKAAKEVHKIKSSLRLWSMDNLVKIAVEIENAAEPDFDKSQIVPLFQRLQLALLKAIENMKKE